jgi:hypothetical protein
MHNTVVKAGDAFSVFSGATIARTTSRNNLFIGGPGGTYGGYNIGTGRVMSLTDLAVASASLDYDGFGSTTGAFSARFGPVVTASTLAQLRSLTSEAHAVQVDMGAFAATVAFPSAPMTEFTAPDLRLKVTGAAIDAGMPIPGINDDFVGAAPDLGAYEVGATLPAYGVRSPEGADVTPPVISALAISDITVSGATVIWTTDESTDGQVEYGPTTAYGRLSALVPTLSTAHNHTLVGLPVGAICHVRVHSRDAAGNLVTSGDLVFTTTSGTEQPTERISGTGGGCGLGGGLAALFVVGSALINRDRRLPRR